MKPMLVVFAAALTAIFAAGCMYPHIPTNIPTNGGAKIVVSNLTLSTPWGTEKIEYVEIKSVENQTTNAAPVPLRPH